MHSAPQKPQAKYGDGVRCVSWKSLRLCHACGNFVAQLDAQQMGAAIVLGIIALAAVSVVLIALANTLRDARFARVRVNRKQASLAC